MAIVKALLLLFLPVAVLFAGGRILDTLADGRAPARTDPENCIPGESKKAQYLNTRLCGYSVADVDRQWGGDGKGTQGELDAERRFLRYDLAFPLFYGGALLVALLLAWNMAAQPFARAWLMAPVVVGMVADWVENLVHLNQLGLYRKHGSGSLDAGWIQVASCATSLKLVALGAAFLLLAGLCSAIILKAIRGPA